MSLRAVEQKIEMQANIIDASAQTAAEDARHTASAEEVARYVAHMTEELSFMARRSGLDLLGYFLEMARVEARAHSGKLSEPN